MSSQTLLKDWLPPIALRAVRKLRGKGIRFEGDYKTWEEAAASCTGYDAPLILEKVLEATLKVKYGKAVFERDSVLFDEIQYSWPVTAALMWAAARDDGNLHVLDFGGSLGSSYFQNRKFISKLKGLSWSVVEQNAFVNIGRKHISDSFLNFYFNIDDCYVNHTPNIVLISSVLQYINDPFYILESLAEKQVGIIVIDRTPFANDSVSKIKVQHVPSEICAASYPCRFFSRDELVRRMNILNYDVIECFGALDKLSNEATWQGFIFEKAR